MHKLLDLSHTFGKKGKHFFFMRCKKTKTSGYRGATVDGFQTPDHRGINNQKHVQAADSVKKKMRAHDPDASK